MQPKSRAYEPFVAIIFTMAVIVVFLAGYVFRPPGTSAASAKSADVVRDGKVDVADLSLVLGQYGGKGSADVNQDGAVNTTDLSGVLSHYQAF